VEDDVPLWHLADERVTPILGPVLTQGWSVEIGTEISPVCYLKPEALCPK